MSHFVPCPRCKGPSSGGLPILGVLDLCALCYVDVAAELEVTRHEGLLIPQSLWPIENLAEFQGVCALAEPVGGPEEDE